MPKKYTFICHNEYVNRQHHVSTTVIDKRVEEFWPFYLKLQRLRTPKPAGGQPEGFGEFLVEVAILCLLDGRERGRIPKPTK